MVAPIDARIEEFGRDRRFRVRVLHRSGPGAKVVGVPGIPCEIDRWTNLLDTLDDRFDAIVVERPGYGESSVAPGPPTFEDQLALVAQFLPGPDAPPCFLIGHSFGSVLALTTALDHPRRVKAVLCVSGPSDPKRLPEWALTMGGRLAQVTGLGGKLEAVLREAADVPGHLERLNRRLASLAVPMAIVHGSADLIVPPVHAGHRLGLLPAGLCPEPLYLEGGDHVIIDGRAADVARAFDALVART